MWAGCLPSPHRWRVRLGVNFARSHDAFRDKEKAPAEPRPKTKREFRTVFRWNLVGSRKGPSLRLLGSAIQLANHIRANLPRRKTDARGFLAFAGFALVLIAQQ